MSSCLFCEVADGNAGMAPENLIIAANEYAFAKPALGQFVDGYTLIVSQEHIRSFSEMSDVELGHVEEMKEKIGAVLKHLYQQPVVVFEHGCGQGPDLRGGSGIDHAHLHVLPLPASLEYDLQSRFRFTRLAKLADLARRGGTARPYIYLETGSGERFTFELDSPIPSQFMRRLICQSLNQPNLWDWRIHPFRERITSFAAAFGRMPVVAASGPLL
jgi:diadenosine tetraphosphate (Ap4A) HIT family hydrolase